MDLNKMGSLASIGSFVIAALLFLPQFIGNKPIKSSWNTTPIALGIFLALGFIFSGFSIWGAWHPRPIDPVPIEESDTYLKLQFGSPDTIPSAVDSKNVFRWYALKTMFKEFDPQTKTFNEASRVWTITITFDRPINFHQIKIDGNGSPLPSYEVKDSSQRTLIVVFGGNISGMIVTIQAA